MDRLSALSRGMQLMLGAGVLLVIDTFFDWQSVDLGPVSVGQSAWNGLWGIVMGLALIVLLAWGAAQLVGIKLSLPVSETLVAAALAAIVLVFAVIKNLADDYSSFWSYAGVVLAALVALGVWMQVRAAGGVDTLRSEVSSMRSSPPAASTTPPPAAQPPSEQGGPPPPTEPPPASSEPSS